MVCSSTGIGCTTPPSGCPDEYGCLSGKCPEECDENKEKEEAKEDANA